MRKRGFHGQLMPLQTMQSIQTKYLPATTHRGSRIKAICERGTLTLPYRYDMDGYDCHREAARQLFDKLFSKDFGGPVVFATGCLPDGTYAHVII
jgi:hypothetical protein